jgi:hypothetical protein
MHQTALDRARISAIHFLHVPVHSSGHDAQPFRVPLRTQTAELVFNGVFSIYSIVMLPRSLTSQLVNHFLPHPLAIGLQSRLESGVQPSFNDGVQFICVHLKQLLSQLNVFALRKSHPRTTFCVPQSQTQIHLAWPRSVLPAYRVTTRRPNLEPVASFVRRLGPIASFIVISPAVMMRTASVVPGLPSFASRRFVPTLRP